MGSLPPAPGSLPPIVVEPVEPPVVPEEIVLEPPVVLVPMVEGVPATLVEEPPVVLEADPPVAPATVEVAVEEVAEPPVLSGMLVD